jgi:hypothetical protein
MIHSEDLRCDKQIKRRVLAGAVAVRKIMNRKTDKDFK